VGDTPSPEQTSWMADLSGLDYRPSACRLEWMQNAEEDVQNSKEFIESVIDEVKPDVLHANQYCYGALSSALPRIVVAHSDVVSWWVAVHGQEPEATPWVNWYRETVGEGLRGADVVVAPSMWMRDAILRHYLPPTPTTVIHNGRSSHLFEPDLPKEHFALSVGRVWDAGKQIDLLKSREHQIPVYIAGREKEPGSSLPGNLSLPPRGEQSQEELRAVYARAPIYVATSRYEPFGLAPLEAALSRCALVANDIPVFRELWGDAAYYFRTNDADDLARALRVLHTDPAQRKLYGDLAYARARNRFSAQSMVNQYMDIYKALIVEKQVA
jgi:glycogen synthase